MATKQPGVWGIDLGQCALKAVRLELQDGEVTATAFDYIEHPKILSQPDADPDQLTREALEGFLKRNDLKGDTVVISVPGQSGLARFVKLPPVEEKKIDAIVTFEAKQQIPFPLEEVVWDFQRLGQGAVSDGYALETEIGLFAMKRDMINRALQQFKEVNVEIHIVQMAPLALCNFVAYDLLKKGAAGAVKEGEDEAAADDKVCLVALDIGADNSNLVITDGEKVIWQRPIPLGGNHFTRTLTKEMKLTFAKAEHIKRNAIKSPDLRKILTALRPVLNDFVNEVQRSLGYFTNTHRNANIGHMIGLGNVFRLPGLQKFLQEKLQLEVVKLSKFERLHGDAVVNAPQFTENIMSFAVAYGLALQGLKVARIHTNLLPQEIRVERLVRAKKPWAAAAAAALLLAVGGLTFGRSIQYSTATAPAVGEAIKLSDSAQQEVQKTKSEYEAEKGKVVESEQAVNRIASGVKERDNWILVYKYINDCLPQPNGSKLAKETDMGQFPFKKYWKDNPAAEVSLKKWSAKRNPVAGSGGDTKLEPGQKQKDEQEIQKSLIQINIEGIGCWYAEDLTTYFKSLKEATGNFQKQGWMHDNDKALVLKGGGGEGSEGGGGDKVPKSGWVFEIRGYHHHQDQPWFVKNTLIANLRNPGNMYLGYDAGTKQDVFFTLPKEIKERVKDKISFVCLLEEKKVPSPIPGQFLLISKSKAAGLVSGQVAAGEKGGPGFVAPQPTQPMGSPMPGGAPGAPGDQGTGQPASGQKSRGNWSPLGEIAAAVFGGGGGEGPGGGPGMPAPAVPMPSTAHPGEPSTTTQGGLQPRIEFIVLFIWQEPTTIEAGAEPAP